jgi:Formin Homology 2 Domain
MRLYNANSSAPYYPGGDDGATWRLPEHRSFVPRPLDQGHDRTQPAKSALQDEDQPQRDKDFQKLSIIPSTTTSTTGGMTPPFDNTSLPSSVLSAHEDNQNQVDHREPSRKATIHPRFAQPVSIHATQNFRHTRYLPPRHELFGVTDLDATDELSRSSSSTLTTTRSMMLSRQKVCTITVSNDPDSTTTESTKQDIHPSPSKRRPKIAGHKPLSAQLRKPSKFEPLKTHVPIVTMKDASAKETTVIENGSTSGYVKSTLRIGSPDVSGVKKKVSIRGNVQISTSRIELVKGSSPFAATLTSGHVPPRSLPAGTTDKLIKAKDRARHSQRSVYDHADCDMENVGDTLEDLLTSGRKTPTARNVRVDFFPLQSSNSAPDIRSSIREERLGVTSNFPKHEWPPTGSVESGWDPLHEDPKQAFSNSMEGGEPLAWATFGSFEDLGYPSQLGSFEFENATIYSFPDGPDASIESEDTSALLGFESADKKENIVSCAEDVIAPNNAAEGGGTTNDYKDHENSTDSRKVTARRRGIGTKALQRQPRLDLLQTPKLLGPLLEARFTRSYWRRLNHTKKDSNKTTVTTDKGQQRKAATADRDYEVMERSVAMEHATATSKDSVRHANGVALSNQECWESLWHPQDVTVSESCLDAAVQKEDAGWGTACLSDSEAKVLSQRRVRECDAVLAGMPMETNDILEAIDVADPSVPLDLKQLESLRSLVPTPAEERMLSKHAILAQKTPSIRISAKAEKFMLELSRLQGARQKLEAMMFHFEFNVDMDKMCKGTSHDISTLFAYRAHASGLPAIECWLFQTLCKELLDAQRLGKVMGILTLIQNRLVGRTPGKKRIRKTSLPSLVRMLEEAEPFSSTTGSDQPVLHYACARLQTTKPALLRFREELPSLFVANGCTSWDALVSDLGRLEQKFENFRKFAVSISTKQLGASGKLLAGGMALKNEIEVLQATSIGSFAIDACLRMAGLYEVFDAAESSIDALVLHFSEEQNKPDMNMNTIIDTFVRFCSYVERFISD